METEEQKKLRQEEQAKAMKENWAKGGWNKMAAHLSGQDKEKPKKSAWLSMGDE